MRAEAHYLHVKGLMRMIRGLMSNEWLSVTDVTPPSARLWREGGVNTGEWTKGGSDGEEKQIEAERKTLDRLHKKGAEKEKQFRGRHRAKWTRVISRVT